MFQTFLNKLAGLTSVHMIFWIRSSSRIAEQGTMSKALESTSDIQYEASEQALLFFSCCVYFKSQTW